MVSTSDGLDARLRRHHEELVRAFAGHRVSTPVLHRRRTRRVIVGLAVALTAAIAAPVLTLRLAPSRVAAHQIEVAGFTITVAASDALQPRLSREQAISAAEAFNTNHPLYLPHGGPMVVGLTVHGAWFVADVQRVVGPCVNVFLPSPTNIWVVPATAPPQSGWSALRGAFLVNDTTGTSNGGDFLIGRAPDAAPVC